VHLRPLRSLSVLAFASSLLLGLAPSAHAAANDKEAQKLFDAAINDDYLNAEFAKAEKKLKEAATKCSSGCSAELVGKIHVAMGTVYSIGLSKNDEAKTEFAAALKADPKAALDPALSNPDLVKLFDEVKKAGGGGSKSTDSGPKTPEKAPVTDAGHTPPPESQVNTPLPIYVEPSDDVPLSKVVLRYKPFGATQYKSVEMRKAGKGYAAEVPCEDVTTTGDVKYFFAFTGADGEAAGGLGSTKEPFKTTIKNELEGDAPKLPGKRPPEQCKEKGDCPPGLPGCEPAKGGGGGAKRGDKGWGSSCDQTTECKEGLVCLNGTCDEDKSGGGGGEGGGGGGGGDAPKKRMNLVGLGVQFDFLSLKSTQTACDGTDPSYSCYLQGSSNQFFGKPVAFSNTDGIQGGGAFAGVRILVSYDRQLLRKVGLTVGVRIGYAFGGPASPSNLDANGNPPSLVGGAPPPQNVAFAFHPLHVEGRLSYALLGSMMDDKKFRPYVFVGGGAAQVNAAVGVTLCDSNVTQADKSTPGTRSCIDPNTKLPVGVARTVDAYQVTGLGFVGFGAGTTFGITPLFGIAAELKFMVMVPTFGVSISPNIGPVFNF
jgi:hypothetical protein